MIIIPAIDIIDGKCVRLSQGNYDSCKVYSDSPVQVAKAYEQAGFSRLHVVDLDGAKWSSSINSETLQAITSGTKLKVDFGGGIKSHGDIARAFEFGAKYVCVGTIARKNPEIVKEWLERYGAEKIILSADLRDGKIAVNGWKEVTDITIHELLDIYGGKIQNMMCTDISRDGMLQGAAVELYEDLVKRYPDMNIIASGGVGTLDDIRRIADTGVQGAVVGKAIYEGKITLEELSDLQNALL